MGWYQQIYDIISSTVFGGETLNSMQEFVVTQFSTVLSMIAANMPLIIVAAFFIWLVKKI